MNEQHLAIIDTIDGILYREGKWTQRRMRGLGLTGMSYCLLGAGERGGYTEAQTTAALGLPLSVVAYNDQNDRTYAQVKMMLAQRREDLKGWTVEIPVEVEPEIKPTSGDNINALMAPVYHAHPKNKCYLGAPEVAPILHDTHNFSLAGD